MEKAEQKEKRRKRRLLERKKTAETPNGLENELASA